MVFEAEVSDARVHEVLSCLFQTRIPHPALLDNAPQTAGGGAGGKIMKVELREGYEALLGVGLTKGNNITAATTDKTVISKVCQFGARLFLNSTLRAIDDIKRVRSTLALAKNTIPPQHEATALILLAFQFRHWKIWKYLMEVPSWRKALGNEPRGTSITSSTASLGATAVESGDGSAAVEFYRIPPPTVPGNATAEANLKSQYARYEKNKRKFFSMFHFDFIVLTRCSSFLLKEKKPSVVETIAKLMGSASKHRPEDGYLRVVDIKGLHTKLLAPPPITLPASHREGKTAVRAKKEYVPPPAKTEGGEGEDGGTVATGGGASRKKVVVAEQHDDEDEDEGPDEGFLGTKGATHFRRRRQTVDVSQFNPWLPQPGLLAGQGYMFAVPYVVPTEEEHAVDPKRGKRSRSSGKVKIEKIITKCSGCKGVLPGAPLSEGTAQTSAGNKAYQCEGPCRRVYHIGCMGWPSPREEIFAPFLCPRCQLDMTPRTPSAMDIFFRGSDDDDDDDQKEGQTAEDVDRIILEMQNKPQTNFLMQKGEQPVPFLAYQQRWKQAKQ